MKKYYLALIFTIAIVVEGYCHNDSIVTRSSVINKGIGLGTVIAAIASWERNKSILLAIIHGFFSWLYVIYFVITRKKSETK